MMASHIIRTASGSVTLAQYCDAWRRVIASPAGAIFKSSLMWVFNPTSREEILREFREGVNDRINRHIPGYGRGRNWSEREQTGLMRDARRLQDMARRIRVYQFETALATRRFGHLLARYDD